MITRINHVGIAVKNIDAMLKLYVEDLGLTLKDIEIVQEQKLRTAIIQVGDSKIELLESTGSDSPIAKHIEKRGEGLHHLALEVTNIKDTLANLKDKNVPLIDVEPRRGVENSSIAFLHPGESKVLLELVEAKTIRE